MYTRTHSTNLNVLALTFRALFRLYKPLPTGFSVVPYYNSIESGESLMSINNTSDPTGKDNDESSGSDSKEAFTRHKVGEALSKDGFGDVLVLSHDAADRVLTPARREIIETLASHDVSSLRQLGEIVNRNPGNLSRDMKVLVAENVVRYESEGKSKRPELKHDTIIQEPLLASEDPIPESLEA